MTLLDKEEMVSVINDSKAHLGRLPNVIEFEGRTLIVGDLHGDMERCTSALRKFKRGEYEHLLFLGDYVDRGQENVSTINTLLGLMLKEPTRVHLLRGNHEIRWVNEKHGFRHELETMGHLELHQTYNEMFAEMPVAAVIGRRVFATHGGVPREIPSISDIQKERRQFQDDSDKEEGMLLGLLWNDPKEDIEGFAPNEKRGRMDYFGRDAFEMFLEKNGLTHLVRGHERWVKGHRFFFDGRLLSVFSSGSYNRPIETKAAVVDGPDIEVIPL